MKKSEWIWRMSRAGAPCPARMRLTGRVSNMRQPRGVRNPQSNDSERTLRIGPTLKRLSCPSTYAAINAVSGRARPRKSRRRRQNLVRPTQFRVLGPQPPQLRHRVLGRLPRLLRDRRVRLVAPTPQRFRRYPRILRHRGDRVRLRRIRGTRLRQQPDRLRLELRRISSALCHGSIISHRVRGNTEQKSVHINANCSSYWSQCTQGLYAYFAHPLVNMNCFPCSPTGFPCTHSRFPSSRNAVVRQHCLIPLKSLKLLGFRRVSPTST